MDSMLLGAIASPRRQEILRLVWSRERSAGDICAAMPDVTGQGTNVLGSLRRADRSRQGSVDAVDAR